MHLTQSYIAGCVTNIKPPGYKTKRHDDERMKLLGLPNGFEIAMNFFHTSAKNQSSFKLAPAMSLLPCKHYEEASCLQNLWQINSEKNQGENQRSW